jgi:hypothetical protein
MAQFLEKSLYEFHYETVQLPASSKGQELSIKSVKPIDILNQKFHCHSEKGRGSAPRSLNTTAPIILDSGSRVSPFIFSVT